MTSYFWSGFPSLSGRPRVMYGRRHIGEAAHPLRHPYRLGLLRYRLSYRCPTSSPPLRYIHIYIYIGRRSATIRTALLSLLCTRRFFTCKMMSKANPAPPNGHLVLEFRLSGSKGFKEERKLEENTFEEKDRSRNSSRFDRVY